jgi:3-hydroxybutyryl-CoA dehydrogenase
MVNKIVVIGAGTMGSGIAQVAVEAGYNVTLVDTKEEYVERGLASIKKFLLRKIEKETISKQQSDEILSRLNGTTNVASGVKDTIMVVEAVYENLQIKHEIFKQLDEICPPDVILASNTSTISISQIASVTKHPERVIGTHFFSPVPLMRLVEVINGEKTSKEVSELTKTICNDFGKTPIAVKDVPGFIVNRLLCLIYNETANMIKQGVASAEDIDAAVKLGCNWPMGVSEIMDMAGVDVVLNALKAMYGMTDEDRYKPSQLLEEMVAQNKLGRKTGQGFYRHN